MNWKKNFKIKPHGYDYQSTKSAGKLAKKKYFKKVTKRYVHTKYWIIKKTRYDIDYLFKTQNMSQVTKLHNTIFHTNTKQTHSRW